MCSWVIIMPLNVEILISQIYVPDRLIIGSGPSISLATMEYARILYYYFICEAVVLRM